MTLFALTYDVRASNHDYSRLYEQLATWRAAHLQNSVWLAELNSNAQTIANTMLSHMHQNDTVSVIQIPSASAQWWTINCRPEGVNWLKARSP